MANLSEPSSMPAAGAKTRARPLLVFAPACSMVLVGALYLGLAPRLPYRVAIHVGPDGVGYGSLPMLMTILCAIVVTVFAIGGATARGFLKAGHWYQIEKSIAVGIISVGYGVIGLALAVILSVVGADPKDVAGDAVGLGALGFLLAFIVACCAYTVLLPRAELETLDRR